MGQRGLFVAHPPVGAEFGLAWLEQVRRPLLGHSFDCAIVNDHRDPLLNKIAIPGRTALLPFEPGAQAMEVEDVATW